MPKIEFTKLTPWEERVMKGLCFDLNCILDSQHSTEHWDGEVWWEDEEVTVEPGSADYQRSQVSGTAVFQAHLNQYRRLQAEAQANQMQSAPQPLIVSAEQRQALADLESMARRTQ